MHWVCLELLTKKTMFITISYINYYYLRQLEWTMEEKEHNSISFRIPSSAHQLAKIKSYQKRRKNNEVIGEEKGQLERKLFTLRIKEPRAPPANTSSLIELYSITQDGTKERKNWLTLSCNRILLNVEQVNYSLEFWIGSTSQTKVTKKEFPFHLKLNELNLHTIALSTNNIDTLNWRFKKVPNSNWKLLISRFGDRTKYNFLSIWSLPY